MVADITVHMRGAVSLEQYLLDNDFEVNTITDSVFSATRDGELPIYINHLDNNLFFEVDLCSLKDIGSEDLYKALLDANTEILPVSAGIDNTNPEDPRLVLVESREADNLDVNELLSVFSAMELATDKMETILSAYVK